MKAKKIISLILATAVVASCACVSFVSANAASKYNVYEQYKEAIKPENGYGLADTVNEGKIIQAWNWSYKNVIANLETLAEQGFTTIQVSPPNEIKMPTKGVKVCEPAVDGIAPNGWWMFYQPAGFQLNESEDNALGVKAEFVEMCEKAHELGLKIIVDAVINHMGTDDDHVGVYDNDSVDPMDHVNPRAKEFEKELLAAKAFHSPWKDMTYVENMGQAMRQYDSTGKPLKDTAGNFVTGGNATEKDIEMDLTRNCTSGLPDLATETQLVQDTIYDYFVELVEAGADGFRFDAAKHIETSHDTYVASDFWEDTLLKLRENYPDKECYAYGEILNKCGDGRPFSEYTELMDVTDSTSYWGIKDSVTRQVIGGWENPLPKYQSEAEGCDPKTVNFTRENVIQWNESHDTYIDGGTSSLTVEQRNKIWALTAARLDITGVYFARPDDRAGNGRPAIEAICADITLGDANLTSWTLPEVAAVNQFDNFFGNTAEYTYTRDGKYAVIERGGVGATIVNIGGMADSAAFSVMCLADGIYRDAITGGKFIVDGGELYGEIGDTGIACIYYAEDDKPVIPAPPKDPYQVPIDPASGSFPVIEGFTTIVFSASQDWTQAYSYCWQKGTDNCLAAWPGTPMKKVTDDNGYGQKQYVAYIPAEYDMYIINNGNGGGSNQTVDLEVPESAGMYMDKTDPSQDGKYTVGYWTPNFYEYEFPTEAPTTPDETEPEDVTTVATEPAETTAAPTEPAETTAATEPAETTAATEPAETTAATEPAETTAAPTEPAETTAATEPAETTAATEPTEGTTAPATPDESEPAATEPSEGTTAPDASEPEATETTAIIDATTTVPGETETSTSTEESTTTEPAGEEYILGDADGNGQLSIKDVTVIQKFLAKFDIEIDEVAAKATQGDKLTIKDATTIQKYLAKLLPEDSLVGKELTK